MTELTQSAGRSSLIGSLRAKVRSQELGVGRQGKRTTPVGDGKHRVSEIVIGVSCSGSGEKRWRTELDLGGGKSLEDHHGAATLGTAPKWIGLRSWRRFWFGLRRLVCVE